jgi:hypothetical protein
MMRKMTKKALGIARGTALTLGVAVMMAMLLGVATTALAGTGVGARFDLGKTNTVNAVTKLVGSVAGPSLQLDNNSTNAAATALDLQVEPGKAPMKVNSDAKVANLNADKIDGKDSTQFQPAGAPVPQDLSLAGGWIRYSVDYGTPAFYEDAEGMVHLEGAIRCTTPDSGCGVVAVLPEGSRPAHELDLPIVAAGPTLGTLSVQPDGRIGVTDPSPGSSKVELFASLEGVAFRAVQ